MNISKKFNTSKFGLALFILCFGLFIYVFTVGEFQISKKTIEKSYPEVASFVIQTDAFKKNESKVFSNQFSYVSFIDKLVLQSNILVISEFGVTPDDISNLVYHSTIDKKVYFSQKSIDLAFPAEVENNELKAQKLSESINWMFGRKFESIENFQDQVNEKVADINVGISEKKGFDISKLTEIKFNITKASTVGFLTSNKWLLFFLTLILGSIAILIYVIPSLKKFSGIKNDGIYHNSATNRGWIGILVGTFLILFYIILYWFPEYLTNWVLLVQPLKTMLNGGEASQWFLYGVLYTLAMLVMGIRMIIKYRHNNYQIVRTISVMFFQLAFAFLIPEIMKQLNGFNFVNMWPLDYDFFFEWNLKSMLNNGTLGIFMLVWGIILFVVGVPVFVYFFGKRWYCSWVCGCGGLAETLGDPYRQLSNKTLKAWKVERWMIHLVLVFAVVMTAFTLYTFFTGHSTVLGMDSFKVRKTYGFLIGSVFSGLIGTGFYPIMGNRTWCRFGCPLAAYLGLVQKFKSRFRITTNGGQCISCGNCSTYCEMGIDVRSYAQKGQNIVRSSCVGCGVCSAVCPRGVLKLENGPEENRVSDLPIILGNDGILKLNKEV